jgi:hypothetical protein
MGFLMTKRSKTPNFIDSRSAGLTKVRLRVPKNNSQPAPQQRPNQRKLTPPLSTLSHWHSIFIQMPSPAILRIIQSP